MYVYKRTVAKGMHINPIFVVYDNVQNKKYQMNKIAYPCHKVSTKTLC